MRYQRLQSSQRGMTFWSLLFVIGVLSFAMFLFFKLFTPYMEDFKVRTALDSLARQPDASSMGRGEIATALSKRFEIDNIDVIDLSKDLVVETRGRKKVIAIRYENVIPMVGNLSVLLQFDHTKEIGMGSE
jgi:hypothetical protein